MRRERRLIKQKANFESTFSAYSALFNVMEFYKDSFNFIT